LGFGKPYVTNKYRRNYQSHGSDNSIAIKFQHFKNQIEFAQGWQIDVAAMNATLSPETLLL
jgi:hypothetical protein